MKVHIYCQTIGDAQSIAEHPIVIDGTTLKAFAAQSASPPCATLLVEVPGGHTDVEIASALGVDVDAVCIPVPRWPGGESAKRSKVFVTMPSVADGEALYERMGTDPVHLGGRTVIGRYARWAPHTTFSLRIQPALHRDDLVAALWMLGGVPATTLQAILSVGTVPSLAQRTETWSIADVVTSMKNTQTDRFLTMLVEKWYPPPLFEDIKIQDIESALQVKRALNGKTVPSGATLRVDVIYS
jgi:hypothetical protein